MQEHGNVNRDMKTLIRNQKEILKIKYTVKEVMNSIIKVNNTKEVVWEETLNKVEKKMKKIYSYNIHLWITYVSQSNRETET